MKNISIENLLSVKSIQDYIHPCQEAHAGGQ